MSGEKIQMFLTFAVLVGVFVIFVKEWVSNDLVALGGLSVLLLLRILDEKISEGSSSNRRR